MTSYGSSPDMTSVDMQLPVMEMVLTFQLVDRPLPVPSMVDMLAIAMGRLLPAMDMDKLQLTMADMLPSATNMTLLNMDSDRMFYGGHASPDSWICLFQLEQQHHEQDMNTNTRTGLFLGGKLLEA